MKKACNKCGEMKEAIPEFFIIEKKVKSGLGACCRVCFNASQRENWKKKSKRVVDEVDTKIEYTLVGEKEIKVVVLPKVEVLKGREYIIQVPRQGKGTEDRVVRGRVIQETDKLVAFQTKNYIECFSKWELASYKVTIR